MTKCWLRIGKRFVALVPYRSRLLYLTGVNRKRFFPYQLVNAADAWG